MSGQLRHSPADVTRHALIGLGVGTLPSANGDWPIFAVGEPSSPDNCITVYNTEGIGEGRDQTDGEIQEHEGLQVRIRTTDPEVGWAKAEAIKQQLDTGIFNLAVVIPATPKTATGTYEVHAITRKTNILDIGRDMSNTNRRLFTINAIIALTQLT